MALIVQEHDLIGAQRKLGVGLPVIVTELDLVNAGVQHLDHGAHLTGPEFARREGFPQRHIVEQFDGFRFHLRPALAVIT
jgi:hypothetical protein